MSAPDLWAAGALPRALFEQSPFSTVVYDAGGRPLAVNAAFTALWGGVTLDAVPADYTVLADVQLAEQGALPFVRRAFAGERVVTPPVCFDMAKVSTTGAGRTVWTQGHWYPVRDDAGRLTHVVLVHTDITERVQAERAIREGEERLRLAQQVARIGTFDWHVPSGRVAWTEEEERIFGLAPGTFDGTIAAWARLVAAEDLAALRAAVRSAMGRGAREMDFAFRIRRPDGEVRHVEGRGAFLYADDGTPLRMVGVNVDVTDRRRTEEELARGERALRAAVERTARLQEVTAAFARALTAAEIARVTLDQGLAALGAQAGVVYLADDAARTLTRAASHGLPEDAVAAWATLDVDGPTMSADALRRGAPLYAARREERLAHYPATRGVSTLGADEAWAAIPLVQGGRRLGVLTVGFAAPRAFAPEERALLEAIARQCAQALERARLYEAEREARAAARAAADRLQTVADAARVLNERSLDADAPGAVVDALADVLARRVGDQCVVRLASPDGEWLEPAAVRHPDAERQALLVSLAGTERYHAADGLTGLVFRSGEPLLVAHADRAGERAALRAALKPAYRPWVDRLGIASLLCIPLRGREGTLGTVWLSRDAPGRPYGEDDLALVEDVAARAGLLLERARLYAAERRARAAAEEASRAKSDFLAAMSHELRTPLNGIGGYVELIEMGLRGPVTEAQRADLDRIRRNQRHLLALIEDVLSFARVEAGRLEVARVPVPVDETLQSLEALVLPQMAARGLRFALVPGDPAVAALGDRERIVQVCVNLLTNAVKATPSAGAVTLWCEADDAAAPDAAVRIRVRDTGVGIPADKREAIFSPFTQLGRTLSSPRAGAGLGLSISRGLAEAMGGSLTVESEEGRGSTFTLTLRRA